MDYKLAKPDAVEEPQPAPTLASPSLNSLSLDLTSPQLSGGSTESAPATLSKSQIAKQKEEEKRRLIKEKLNKKRQREEDSVVGESPPAKRKKS